MADAEDMTALEYARHYGIAIDHRAASPLDDIKLCTEWELAELPLTEVAELHRQTAPLREKLTMQKDAAWMLHSLKRLSGKLELDNEGFYSDRYQWLKRRKVDVSLLRYDEEEELQKFKSREALDVYRMNIPLEAVEPDWVAPQDPAGLVHGTFTEDIPVPEDALDKLKDYTESDTSLKEELRLKRRKAIEPLTPPLSPTRPLPPPYSPTASEARLRSLSPVDSLEGYTDEAALQHYLNTVENQASLQNTEFDHPEASFENRFNDFKEQPYPPKIRESARIEQLRVSSPILFLDDPGEQDIRANVQDELSMLQPAVAEDLAFEDAVNASEQEMQKYLEKTAREIKEQVEHEKLIEAVYKARVEIPALQLWRPIAPWSNPRCRKPLKGKTQVGSAVRCLEENIGRLGLEDMMWPGVKAVELKLTWNPFSPKHRSSRIEEEIRDSSWDQTIEVWETEGRVKSGQLGWKPDGLRILDESDGDEDEELELSSWRDGPESGGLKDTFSQLHALVENLAGCDPPPSKFPNTRDMEQTPLDQFMYFHGIAPSMKPHQQVHEEDIGQLQFTEASSDDFAPDMTELPEDSTPALDPMDGLRAPETSPPFFICSSLLNRGRFLAHLEEAYPGVQLLERAFGNPSPEDADFIISPALGVLHSSIQRANQKSLPGSSEVAGFRGKLLRLLCKYEQLFVLLTNGDIGTAAKKPVSRIDKSAVADFEHFVASSCRPGAVSVVVIGGDGDGESLARWISSLMIRHGKPTKHLERLDSGQWEWETREELLLRERGLNAFAACAVMAQLRKLLPWTKNGAGTAGGEDTREAQLLQAFFDVAHEERVRIFAPLLGGRHALDNFQAHCQPP